MRVLLLAVLVLALTGSALAARVDVSVDAPHLALPGTATPPLPAAQLPHVPSTGGASDVITTLGVDASLPPSAGDPAPHKPNAPLIAIDAPAAATAAATAGGAVLVLAGFALYSRLGRSELLDHERREAISTLIREHAGVSLSEIAERLGIGWGTTVYHLDRLEKAGLVVSEKSAGRRCYFPIGTVPREARPAIASIQQDTSRAVADLVAARPGLTQTELCDGLGLSASAASKQVTKLESAGLLRREREWKTVRLFPGPMLAGSISVGASA